MTSDPQHHDSPDEDHTSPATDGTHDADLAERVNSEIRYVMYSVFAVDRLAVPRADHDGRKRLAAEVDQALAPLLAEGLVVRGWYDLTGQRADADLLIWWHAPTLEVLQSAYREVLATELGGQLSGFWSQVAIHRPAEFNRGHVPAFLSGEEPGQYICVYPFVRSYDWYVLPEDERRDMLREHGLAARDYADVRANTLAAFALGDYEWILAFEAAELHRIVDLMRELRNTRARLYVRDEIPFFTGPRVEVADWIRALP